MPERKTIICLANSRKRHGRCIAGIELVAGQAGGWVRPVSARPEGEVSEYERQYEDGSDPKVLDIVSVPLIRAAPDGYQAENWLLSPSDYWIKDARLTWEQLSRHESPPAALWPSDAPPTRYGRSDRVHAATADAFGYSLRLVRASDLSFQVLAPSADFGDPKRQVRANFSYLGEAYGLAVTDPVVERAFLARDNGTYDIGDAYLTVSLGERHTDGYCYKLVAAVIDRWRAEGGF